MRYINLHLHYITLHYITQRHLAVHSLSLDRWTGGQVKVKREYLLYTAQLTAQSRLVIPAVIHDLGTDS